jgi:PAS domain-containing protein
MPEPEKRPDPLEAMRVHQPVSVRPWGEILPNEMAAEMLTRDGRFQIMVSFMRISSMAALIIDEIDRIIFMNASAERYWKVRVWDVRGKPLGEIMNLDEPQKRTMSHEHAAVLSMPPTGGAQVFYEHFRNGSERMSMLKFPFTEDDDHQLIGCFVLPANVGGDPKLGY